VIEPLQPRHVGPDQAAQFRESGVAAAYRHRPPYPAKVFETLAALLPNDRSRVLELGCGTGDLTIGLAPHVGELHAIDPSPVMLTAALKRPGGVPASIRYELASAEAYVPRGSFALVVAAESLHWMDWARVVPKIATWLAADAVLAIVTPRVLADLPWERTLEELVARFSTNEADLPEDIVDELTRRSMFRELAREPARAEFNQSVADYVESFHSRNGLSRERLGEAAADAFDRAVHALVLTHCPDGLVRADVTTTVVWGRPS
jgi:trans-aconitate methyltransferase